MMVSIHESSASLFLPQTLDKVCVYCMRVAEIVRLDNFELFVAQFLSFLDENNIDGTSLLSRVGWGHAKFIVRKKNPFKSAYCFQRKNVLSS